MLSYQLTSQDLANRRLGQFISEFVMCRHFIRSKMFLAESLEFLFCQGFTGLYHDPRLDGFATMRIGDAAHAHLQHLGMRT